MGGFVAMTARNGDATYQLSVGLFFGYRFRDKPVAIVQSSASITDGKALMGEDQKYKNYSQPAGIVRAEAGGSA